jgi:hypothetical protein
VVQELARGRSVLWVHCQAAGGKVLKGRVGKAWHRWGGGGLSNLIMESRIETRESRVEIKTLFSGQKVYGYQVKSEIIVKPVAKSNSGSKMGCQLC